MLAGGGSQCRLSPYYWEFSARYNVTLLSRENYGEISVPTMGITNSSIEPHQQVQKHNQDNISLFTTFITSEKVELLRKKGQRSFKPWTSGPVVINI
jgi:hypothetical protein